MRMNLEPPPSDLHLDVWMCAQVVQPRRILRMPSFCSHDHQVLAVAHEHEWRRARLPALGADGAQVQQRSPAHLAAGEPMHRAPEAHEQPPDRAARHRVLAREASDLDSQALRQLSDTLLAQIKSGVVILGRRADGKASLIDTLSLETYREGYPWVALRQFCQHFLAPLALMSYQDVRLSQLLRSYLDGAERLALRSDRVPQLQVVSDRLRTLTGFRVEPVSGLVPTRVFYGALADRSFHRSIGGRTYDLYYSGSHLHMVVLRVHDRSYWVVNTLLDSLSNETMLAIAKGLKPLTHGK